MKRILFVCSGNTCRSPLAEAIAKQVLPGRLDFDVEIASAGTSALDGSPARATPWRWRNATGWISRRTARVF
jgi:protein-tyrosine-phosphatase